MCQIINANNKKNANILTENIKFFFISCISYTLINTFVTTIIPIFCKRKDKVNMFLSDLHEGLLGNEDYISWYQGNTEKVPSTFIPLSCSWKPLMTFQFPEAWGEAEDCKSRQDAANLPAKYSESDMVFVECLTDLPPWDSQKRNLIHIHWEVELQTSL